MKPVAKRRSVAWGVEVGTAVGGEPGCPDLGNTRQLGPGVPSSRKFGDSQKQVLCGLKQEGSLLFPGVLVFWWLS